MFYRTTNGRILGGFKIIWMIFTSEIVEMIPISQAFVFSDGVQAPGQGVRRWMALKTNHQRSSIHSFDWMEDAIFFESQMFESKGLIHFLLFCGGSM